MSDLSFLELVGSIPSPEYSPPQSSRLKISDEPSPFVAPNLEAKRDAPMEAEVLLVKAPAAVGKSTLAKYLSANRRVPFLDLSRVPVATGSLQAMISNLDGSGEPKHAFHDGELPLVVDALDEGRLLSGENSFEFFLFTAAEFLTEDRSAQRRPKLLLFGREQAIETAKEVFQLHELEISEFVVSFFGKKEAEELLHEYAQKEADPSDSYVNNPEPANRVVHNYFNAIEGALGLDEGTLWHTKKGRAFAGYAPVLEALGSLIAKIDNFIDVANRVKDRATKEAWDVIETVIDEILVREKKDFQEALSEKISSSVPNNAYDKREQLTLLSHYVHGKDLQLAGHVQVSGGDQREYISLAEQKIEDHPFVRLRNGKPDLTNDVLGSVVLAHTVIYDMIEAGETERLGEGSRQPFLWRSIRSVLDGESLIDGIYVGYILRSFWNDPITETRDVSAFAGESGDSIAVSVHNYDGDEIVFRVLPPLRLFTEIWDCSINIDGEIEIRGAAPRGSDTLFSFYGENKIIADRVTVDVDSVAFQGRSWLQADEVVTRRKPDVRVKNGAEVGWGEAFSDSYPWNQYPSTVESPESEGPDSRLSELLAKCRNRFPPGVIILREDLSPVEDEAKLGWIRRDFPESFSRLVEMMIDYGLASKEKHATSGTTKKVHVHFNTRWETLWRGLQDPEEVSDEIRDFLVRARKEIG